MQSWLCHEYAICTGGITSPIVYVQRLFFPQQHHPPEPFEPFRSIIATIFTWLSSIRHVLRRFLIPISLLQKIIFTKNPSTSSGIGTGKNKRYVEFTAAPLSAPAPAEDSGPAPFLPAYFHSDAFEEFRTDYAAEAHPSQGLCSGSVG